MIEGTAHEVCHFDFFIEGEHFGTIAADGAEVGIRSRWRSLAFFCASCGDVWARIVLTRSAGRSETFDCRQVACAKHYDQWNLAGSVLGPDLDAFVQYLPAALAAREFSLHLNEYLKETGE